jgi:hypothetical protein
VLAASAAHPAFAFPVIWGTSWDGPSNELQKIVDARYGVGAINVHTDYIGYHPGDPDPFEWVDDGFDALIIKEVAGNANRNFVGWYRDNGVMPVIDGIEDGVVFSGPANASNPPVFIALGGVNHFGFYMNPNGLNGATNAPEPELFFTNRFYNDIGPSGAGALHAPLNGDGQALVYDVSYWRGANTWLVCFEDLDYGATPSPCCTTTDNDFNDFVFEVNAVGVTPAQRISMGALKVRYR